VTTYDARAKVGEIRPSQLLHTFGVGAIIDLPNISAMVMGLDDWTIVDGLELAEDRLLTAVQRVLGDQVRSLRPPPGSPDAVGRAQGFEAAPSVGVPVAPFPRWMLCTFCRLLAPLKAGLFELKTDPFRSDRARYAHGSCRAQRPPTVVPARFLLACENGHLDDFPWSSFVHHGEVGCRSRLTLREHGMTGEAADILLRCDICKTSRRMAEAFGDAVDASLGVCRGRRPHLRDFADQDCDAPAKPILLGASNGWFPITLTALSIPTATNTLAQLVTDHWTVLNQVTSLQNVELLRSIGQLRAFGTYSNEEIWAAIEAKRHAEGSRDGDPSGLKPPEWQVFVHPEQAGSTEDFRVRPVEPPAAFAGRFARVVLVERLREVKALIGFTRLQSPGDFDEEVRVPEHRRGALARRSPRWVPAVDVRGEGVFMQFDGGALKVWLGRGIDVDERQGLFDRAHRQWWMRRGVTAPGPWPGLGYALLHSFSHALMRQLSVECGYALASIRERIYYLPPEAEHGPMAGLLIYTSAQDSEGTLGGLVSLGEPEELGRHVEQALERVRLCASDPLCSEHQPDAGGTTLHGAACHACLFIPETSCERGNKYLDRAVLVKTLSSVDLAFFDTDD
jgi:hypothetical protein